MTIFIFLDSQAKIEDVCQHQFTVVKEQLARGEYETTVLGFSQLLSDVEQGQDFWLVLPAKLASLHILQLPKLSRKDLLPALRSMLEEQMIDDFDKYHCFYQSVSSGAGLDLLVGLTDKTYLDNLVYQFEANGVQLAGVTLDWYALKPNEALLLSSEEALVRTADFLGWVPKSLLKAKLLPKLATVQVFAVKSLDFAPLNTEVLNETFFVWLIKRCRHHGLFDILMPYKAFNLLDKLPKAKAELYTKRGVLVLFISSILFFMGLFLSNSYQHYKNKQMIASFITEPSENLEAKLTEYRLHQAQKNQFWKVYIGLQKSYLPEIKILNFSYTQGVIHLSLSSNSTSDFQSFKQNLRQNQIQAQESQVLVSGQGLKANLDLRSL